MDLETVSRAADGRSAARPPCLLFVGVLERYKAVDVLADAWRLVAHRIPAASAAHRRPRGDRRRAGAARRRVPRTRQLDASGSRPTRSPSAMDDATALVLPSRSEGLGHGSWSRRSAAAAPWSAAGSAGSPTSSWTAGTASSCPSGTRGRWPTRSSRVVTDPRAREPARRRRAAATRRLAGDAGGLRARARRARRARWRRREGRSSSPRRSIRRAPCSARRWRRSAPSPRCVDEVVVLADRAVDGALPANCSVHLFRSAHAARARAPLRGGAGPRARARPAPHVRARAHVPHLRRARGAARPPARVPRAPLVHALAREPAARRRRAACRTPSSPSRSARSRSPRARWSRSATASTWPASRASSGRGASRCGSWPSAGPRPPRGSRRSCARSPPSPASRLDVVGPSLTDEERAHRAALEQLVAELARERPRPHRRARFRASRCRSCSPRPTRS